LLANSALTSWYGRIGIVDLGDWSIRNWRALAGLTSALLVVSGGLAGSITDYRSYFPALGGPNGLLYDLTLKVAQPWRRNIPTVPAVFVAIDDASLSTPDLAALPRALFQPVWARLIDGLLEARARRIAFDVVPMRVPISKSAPLFCQTTTAALSTVSAEPEIASSSGDFPAFRRRLLS
jgi:CHASE2 domain